MTEDNELQLQMECTIFFQENPYTMESRDGLAQRLGRKPEQLEQPLQRLVSLSILEIFGDGSRSIYRYSQPKVYTEDVGVWKNK